MTSRSSGSATKAEPAGAGATTWLLLPERRRFQGQALPPPLARALGRADRLPPGEAGEQAQLQRHFSLLPRGWPMAAITRQFDAGDAGLGQWLRADPAHVRPDQGGARVLAVGELGLDAAEAEALLAPLRPLFGDAGFPISAPVPQRWYLALPRESRLPRFSPPEAVLGDDLFAHLPEGDLGRRWRALLNEAQVLLHHHPVNTRRAAAGQPTVNSLCFWGAGLLPDHVQSRAAWLDSQDPELLALAALAGLAGADGEGSGLVDQRGQRDLADLSASVATALEALAGQRGASLVLDFADGQAWRLAPGQRWRFWRRPLASLA